MANAPPRPAMRVVPGSNPPPARVVRGSDPPPFRSGRSSDPSPMRVMPGSNPQARTVRSNDPPMRTAPAGSRAPLRGGPNRTQRGDAPPPDKLRRKRRSAPPPPFGDRPPEPTRRLDPDSPLAKQLRDSVGRPPTGTPPALRTYDASDEPTRAMEPDVLLRTSSRRPLTNPFATEPSAPFSRVEDILGSGPSNGNDERQVNVRRAKTGNDRGLSYSDVDWDLEDG
jgi:hypothetical protein